MGDGLGRITRHPEYYLNDGSVSFLTGNTLFRVHQSFFERESEVFRDLFASGVQEDPQSGSDASPFTLDIHPDDFGRFLWVWYDREYSYHQQPKAHWVSILQLSTRWKFPKIRELAVRELEAMELPPAERISIYNEHGIDDERLFSSYVELCKSPTVPSEREAELIKMETLINILQAREDAQRRAVELGHESPTSASLEDETLREIVSRFFKPGLNLRLNGASTGSEVQASILNGERPQGTTSANATITLQKPQVPNKAETASGQPSHGSSSLQTGGKGTEHQAKGENQADAVKTTQEKEKEKLEKARQAKEEAEKAEKVKQAKEKEEKAKQEQEKEARERAQRQGGRGSQQNSRK